MNKHHRWYNTLRSGNIRSRRCGWRGEARRCDEVDVHGVFPQPAMPGALSNELFRSNSTVSQPVSQLVSQSVPSFRLCLWHLDICLRGQTTTTGPRRRRRRRKKKKSWRTTHRRETWRTGRGASGPRTFRPQASGARCQAGMDRRLITFSRRY